MEIEGPDGKTIATVKKDLINVLRDHWTVKIKGGPNLDVKGNVLDFNYRIKEGRHEVAEVSKKFFRVRDTYRSLGYDGPQRELIVSYQDFCKAK